MKISYAVFACWILICASSSLSAAVVTFNAMLDSDIEPHTSASAPYATSTNQSDAPAGIPDNTTTIYSDKYYYADAATGIEFDFDVTWRSRGGNLNGSATTLGVGASNDVGTGEQLGVSVSNLQVDLANYLAGSVSGIVTPTLNSADVAFRVIGFADRTSGAADESIVDIQGSSLASWGTAAGGVGDNRFVFGSDGLTTSETSIVLSHNVGSTVDTDFSLAFTRFRVTVDLSQNAVGVPEPSSAAVLLLLWGSVASAHRRKRIAQKRSAA